MRYRILALFAVLAAAAPVAYAQEATLGPAETEKPTLQQRLLPENAAPLFLPAPANVTERLDEQPSLTTAMAPGRGIGLMIAGGALFVAGLLIDGDAGTLVAVTGAALGAYGLYIYFQ